MIMESEIEIDLTDAEYADLLKKAFEPTRLGERRYLFGVQLPDLSPKDREILERDSKRAAREYKKALASFSFREEDFEMWYPEGNWPSKDDSWEGMERGTAQGFPFPSDP